MRADDMAMGVWRARKNLQLVQRVRALWARAHDHLNGRLRAKHVYGHTATGRTHAWNN